MLRAAILRALAEKDARLMRVQPHFVDAIRNEVCLSGKLRNPETVVGVGGKQLQVRGRTHGNMQLVRCDNAECWITKFPPKLMSDDGHRHAFAGLAASCIAWITRAVVRNRTTTIRIGMTVQASSICVLPYTWVGSRPASAARLRNFTIT